MIPAMLALLLIAPNQGAIAKEADAAKVMSAYAEGNSTKLVIESSATLVSGRQVYVGPHYIPVVVGDLLSKSEYIHFHKALAAERTMGQKTETAVPGEPKKELHVANPEAEGQMYYYAASVPGRAPIRNGDAVHLEPPMRLAVFSRALGEDYFFEEKAVAEVTAVQGDRAMIDRGSVQEAKERDLYRVYDSSGHYKCMLELRGIGDFQSQGKLYDALEHWGSGVPRVEPGDRVVFVGQRKLFTLGMIGGTRLNGNEEVLSNYERTYGAGLLWATTTTDGLSLEMLFGEYYRAGEGRLSDPATGSGSHDTHSTKFIAPIWLKKNFFYPSIISPFVGAGMAWMIARNHYYSSTNSFTSTGFTNQIIDEDAGANRLVPVLGGGLELFPARFFRPRIEARWFGGPKVTAGPNTYRTESWFWSVGFLTSW